MIGGHERNNWESLKSFLHLLYVDIYRSLWILVTLKENQTFLIYKEIQIGAVAKSYMRKGFLIYEEMRKYFR